MPEPMSCAGCYTRTEIYCDRCDLLVGLPGMHVINVAEQVGGGLTVTVESPPAAAACRVCGVIAASNGRRTAVLVDVPCFGRETGSGRHLGSVPRLQERHRRPTRRRHLGARRVSCSEARRASRRRGPPPRRASHLWASRPQERPALRTCCAAVNSGSPTDNRPGSRPRPTPTNDTWRCSSPGSALNSGGRSSTRPAPPRDGDWRPRSSTVSRPVRSPRSPTSAVP